MSTSWRHFPKSRSKPARDFHRPRYGNPLFPNAAGSKVVRRNANGNNRSTRRSLGDGAPNKRRNLLIAAGLLILGGAWYVFWGSAFRITKTEFSGTTPYTEETLRKALTEHQASNALLIFPRNNVLLFSESSAKDAIKDAVYLDDISITKKLPDTVIVTVKEKTMRAVLDRGGRLYAVDESGYLLRELTSKEHLMMPDLPPGLNAVSVEGLGAEAVTVTGGTVTSTTPAPDTAGATEAAPAETADAKKSAPGKPVGGQPPSEPVPGAVTDAQPAPPKNAWPLILDHNPEEAEKKPARPGLQAYTPSTLSTILQASARLPDVTGETIRWFVPDESSNSVDVMMSGGWHAYLATATPFDVQVDRLSIILKDKIGPKRGELEYVDLRYNEKIFYRLKNQTK